MPFDPGRLDAGALAPRIALDDDAERTSGDFRGTRQALDHRRIKPGDAPHRGMLVALAGDATLRGKPTSVPRLEVLSEVEVGRLASYDRPTWLDEAIVGRLRVQEDTPGFPAELRQALADRAHWLAKRGLADLLPANEVLPKPQMMRGLRQRGTARLSENLSRQLSAIYVPHEPGSRVSGIYERSMAQAAGASPSRQAPGVTPVTRLKARLKAASDS
jgi:hypothetical protein